MRSGALLALLLALGSGCVDEPCVEDLDSACAPLSSDVSWSNVYTTVIAPNCATAGLSCHSAAGAQGGLDLSDEQTAWDELLDDAVGPPRVLAGDAACSDAMKRIESDNRAYQMPPGASLSAPQACMVQLWIEGGATR
jgi:hypothetical protein